jgi:UPF0176 protein
MQTPHLAAGGLPTHLRSQIRHNPVDAWSFDNPSCVDVDHPVAEHPSRPCYWGVGGQTTLMQVTVASFYKFARMDDYREWRTPLTELCRDLGVYGTILLAPEGINGTLSGSRDNVEAVLDRFRQDPRFATLEPRYTVAVRIPFGRLRVRLKKEIVAMKVPVVNPAERVGEYIAPKDWNDLVQDPDVTLIDTRNAFEVQLGTFEGAIDPKTRSFGEFPHWADQNLDPQINRKVAIFCTGGIRCEKATAYLLSRGFSEVYHLKGGILGYLDQVSPSESLWRGECFVFDDRGTEAAPSE